MKRKQIRGTPKTKKRINGKPIEKYDINISKSKDAKYSYQPTVYLIREMQTDKKRIRKKKRKFLQKKVKQKQFHNKVQSNNKRIRKRKDKQSQKRKLVPKSKKVDN